MPVYDYKCNNCGTIYDVFHKVREVIEEVVCPSCGSEEHTRLISAPSFTLGKKSESPTCNDGSCCGGSCSLN